MRDGWCGCFRLYRSSACDSGTANALTSGVLLTVYVSWNCRSPPGNHVVLFRYLRHFLHDNRKLRQSQDVWTQGGTRLTAPTHPLNRSSSLTIRRVCSGHNSVVVQCGAELKEIVLASSFGVVPSSRGTSRIGCASSSVHSSYHHDRS